MSDLAWTEEQRAAWLDGRLSLRIGAEVAQILADPCADEAPRDEEDEPEEDL